MFLLISAVLFVVSNGAAVLVDDWDRVVVIHVGEPDANNQACNNAVDATSSKIELSLYLSSSTAITNPGTATAAIASPGVTQCIGISNNEGFSAQSIITAGVGVVKGSYAASYNCASTTYIVQDCTSGKGMLSSSTGTEDAKLVAGSTVNSSPMKKGWKISGTFWKGVATTATNQVGITGADCHTAPACAPIDMVVWENLADAQCHLTNSGDLTKKAEDSYKIYCNGDMPTVAYYTGTTASPDLTCAGTPSTTLGGPLFELSSGTYVPKLQQLTGGSATALQIYKLKVTTAWADRGCSNPAGGSASTVGTAAAAAVLAAGALIL